MSNLTSEKSVVNAILKYLNGLPRCRARKRWGKAHNTGEPDIYGCIDGLHFELEVKRPGGGQGLSKIQKKILAEWRATGCLAEKVESLEEVKTLVTKLSERSEGLPQATS